MTANSVIAVPSQDGVVLDSKLLTVTKIVPVQNHVHHESNGCNGHLNGSVPRDRNLSGSRVSPLPVPTVIIEPPPPDRPRRSPRRQEKPKMETIVNFDLTEEQTPPNRCCCGKIKVQKASRIIALLSMVAVITNALLYICGVSRLGLNGYLEVFILVCDFFAVTFLILGLSKDRPGMLKPFLFFNVIWVCCLSLLFLVCSWQLIRGGQISRNLLSNLQSIGGNGRESGWHKHGRHTRHDSTTMACVVTVLLMVALACLILIDYLFIHVVYKTFLYMSYKEDKKKEQQRNNGRI